MSRPIRDTLFRLLPSARPTTSYILAMTLLTRLLAATCAALCVVYIISSFRLPAHFEQAIKSVSAVVIVIAVIATVLLSLWLTRDLRRALRTLGEGRSPDPGLADRAGRQAVLYPGRHARYEALIDPLCVVVPLFIHLWLVHDAPARILAQILMVGFFGISCVVMMTYFINERWMAPIVKHLLDHGVPIPFDQLPLSRLHIRINLCFSITIVATTLMIGALANQRAMDIVKNPDQQEAAVADLQQKTIVIMLTATAAGLLLSRALARSVTVRVQSLVDVMKRVQDGSLSQRLQPAGNDELDLLTRQFNLMVGRLERDDQTIRDLNANLEKKVTLRTRQLSRSKQKLQKSLKKLQEYDRLKTEFFSNVSHELRTPLTMILTPVERLLDEESFRLPSEALSLLRIVSLNGRRLLKLINQLLDFAKLEAGRATLRRGPVNLRALLSDLVATAEPVAQQRRIDLRLEVPDDLPSIEADADKLDTIITNLLSNALKFTPGGGQVRVHASRAEADVRIAVTDTGAGIAPEHQHRIFERFVQLDGSASREFSGTGLGLALAKELVELHGGTIGLESRPGEGSAFWFTLPLAAASRPGAPAAPRTAAQRVCRFADLTTVPRVAEPAPRPVAGGDAPLILVVDDTAELREFLYAILSEHYQVLAAADGAEGLRLAREHLPDLILSDVMMPELDGYEFCRRMKGDPATARIPFVLLTAKAAVSMKVEGLECGADDYLVKPFETDELLARTRSLLKLRGLHREIDQRNQELQAAVSELQTMQAQLVHSEKMTSLGQLVAGLAHEINNSINAVYNGIQPLCSRATRLEQVVLGLLDAPERISDQQVRGEIADGFERISVLADVIQHGARRTARIVSDLKTFSHPGSERPEAFDLHQALDVCLTLLSNHLKHRITVHKDYGEIGAVVGPAGQINQVFMNILNNAQQAIAGKGEITITTRKENDRVRVSIRDTGPGIAEAVRSRIFDPFFTTKAPGVGTGLGLSISYSIITGLGGSLSCSSEPGRGTEFVVSLPANSEPLSALKSQNRMPSWKQGFAT